MKTPTMNNALIAIQDVLAQNKSIRDGRNAMIDNRDAYFTRLDRQDDDQFESMIKMSPMYILYPKVVDGFVGTVFAKSPNLTGIDTEKYLGLTTNVDMLGNSINKLSESVVQSVMENGFCATINDYSDKVGKSFIRYIKPENFISFRISSDKGFPEISQFIYKETIEKVSKDSEFDTDTVLRYVVLDIIDGKYRTRTFEAEDNKQDSEVYQVGSDVYPTMNSKNFNIIPVEIHGVQASNFTVSKSTLQDISDMNISVMQRTVDQTYMLHWTALPTPWVTGIDDDDSPTTIGPTEAWHISNPDAKVGMLEFSGNSARAHQDFIDNLKDIMAATGAQILKKEGVSRETATSVLVRTAAQTSLVTTMVENISGQLENTLQRFFEWEGVEIGDDFSYKLNSDFVKVDMEPNAQIALVKSWLDGAVSHETLFDKMKEGELINPNRTFDQELKSIKENPPPFFQLNQEAEINAKAAKLSEKNEDVGDDRGKGDGITDPIKGSNLENGKVANKQATEQV